MSSIKCTSCGQQRAELHHLNSKIYPTMEIWLCNDCKTKKYEPRFLIVLVAKSLGGLDTVRPYINNKRYIGEPILADELL